MQHLDMYTFFLQMAELMKGMPPIENIIASYDENPDGAPEPRSPESPP